mmetsp:Transcript_129256/g.237788  ORF Transcript_129256/g.237788 Transcript_129256/m.237788 type:complete len:83 (+) Transcript_129256:60-308(+)
MRKAYRNAHVVVWTTTAKTTRFGQMQEATSVTRGLATIAKDRMMGTPHKIWRMSAASVPEVVDYVICCILAHIPMALHAKKQ